MTKFAQKSFTVSMTASSAAYAGATCREYGHMEPDVRGKCLRCGEPAMRTHVPIASKADLSRFLATAAPCSDFSKPEDWTSTEHPTTAEHDVIAD